MSVLDGKATRALAGQPVRTWTTVGESVMGLDLEGEPGEGPPLTRQRVERAIAGLEWMKPKRDGDDGVWTLAMGPGEGIKVMIKQLRIPKVYELAVSRDLAPYGLYGIKARYKNGSAEIFAVDTGVAIVMVCSDFTDETEGSD